MQTKRILILALLAVTHLGACMTEDDEAATESDTASDLEEEADGVVAHTQNYDVVSDFNSNGWNSSSHKATNRAKACFDTTRIVLPLDTGYCQYQFYSSTGRELQRIGIGTNGFPDRAGLKAGTYCTNWFTVPRESSVHGRVTADGSLGTTCKGHVTIYTN
jgi:hypothetical protein